MNKDRFKNPYFWFGLLGVFFTATGIDETTLTSWDILAHKLMDFINNPFLVLSVASALTGVFVDPTTKGIKDSSSLRGRD